MSNRAAAIPSTPQPNEVTRAEIPVQGMTCANCARRVERALNALPGVTEASVNFATRRASVHYNPQTLTDPERLTEAVEAAGYQVPRAVAAEGALRDVRADGTARADVLEQAELREQRNIRRDFALAAALTIPLLAIAMSHGAIPWAEAPVGRFLQFALATPVVFGPGMRFVKLAWAALKHRSSDMNTLVTLGVLSAWAYSTAALFAPSLFPHAEHGARPHLYFEAAAAILTFVLLGRLLETRARRRLSDAVRGLVQLVPAMALRVKGEQEEQVAVSALRPRDLVLVRPGERVPVDGQVVRGVSAVNESMLTGESIPVDKQPGAKVYAGTLNQGGAFTLRVTRTGGDTALARIVDAVEQAQGSRAPIARLADVVSSYFVPAVLVIALLTGLGWLLLDPTDQGLATAVERFVAVLVIACPCALGLATPAAVAVGTGRGAELGVLIKGGAPLEAVSRVDTVLLDKTGTLTRGRPELTDVRAFGGLPERELLSWVASVERESEHPVARAIVEGARARGAAMLQSSDFAVETGAGVQGSVSGRTVRIGTREFLRRAGIDPTPLDAEAEGLARRGRTPSFVAVDGQLAGVLAVADRPSEHAPDVVRALTDMGIEVVMLTGDRQETAEAVARELGITRVIAQVSPEDKARVVAEERARNRVVAMVGDGINDAPALASAHVGIAVGSGTDIAIAAADVALLRDGIGSLPRALELARRTLRTIRQNLFWAFVYNVVGIPIAAGLLYPYTGWLLSPVLASAAMSLSSISVLLNSLRLRRFDARHTGPHDSQLG